MSQAEKLREQIVEAARIGLSAPRKRRRAKRKNPLYQRDPQWDAMLAVSAGCRNMMEKVRGIDPHYVIGGFVDDGQRQRNLASIRECRDFLNLVLDAA